jgi:LCP family protein required for cell wall assembly
MSEIWSIPLVRISVAVGFAVVFLVLLTPLWDRHFQTAGRRRVWCMLVIALLVAPWLRLPVPVVAESLPLQEIEEDTAAVRSTSERVSESPLWMSEPAPAENESPSVSETYGTPSGRISIKLAAAGLYLTGAILFLLYQCIGHLLFFRKVRRWAHPVSDSGLLEQYSALTASLYHPPRLLILLGLSSPMLAGLLRPVLLLPRESESSQSLQWALRHELIHWRRHDLLWKALALAANALHWFNPLVWLLRQRLDRDLEQSCDEAVVQGAEESDRRSYGAVILSAASGGRSPAMTTSLRGEAKVLHRRLKRIMDGPQKRGRGWSLLCGIMCLVLVLSACAREVASEGSNSAADTLQPESVGERKNADMYTVLIAGQAGPDNNTDTILLASYDVASQKVTVVNIPRETMVNVPWDIKTIGSVCQYYGGGDEGMLRLREVVTDLFGFAPDYTIRIDLDAFGEIVDTIGGVGFDVPLDMDYEDPAQDLSIHINQGYQTLNGQQAMGVVRFRTVKNGLTSGNIGRIDTQQAFLRATANQILQIQNISQISQIAETLAENVNTDLSASNILWFMQQAILGGLDVEDIRFVTLPGEWSHYRSQTFQVEISYYLPDENSLVDLINDQLSPFTEEVTQKDLAIMSVDHQGTLHCSSGPLA